ncbi:MULTISPECIES: hypothetical protein [unclassified Pseudomonas]|uniref:hypothetical protein n=1 Tax=unclassified Pseudomonas TaxID=196821 RepID=UPI002449AF98|nr:MULTISPECIES: hypothetical protein [unclassified Pseudomonas]MDG9925273.1 hypothetical protein [Pseudomonas sp. GD04045]MDH0036072.1 hypothetical protein [Pseudomonas sp. GD04019]
MRMIATSTMLLLAFALSGCASNGGGDHVQVKLAGTAKNAGRIGQATLSPRGELTDVSAFISGVPFGTTLPVRLYAYIYLGSCQQPGAQPVYELNNTVLTDHRGSADGWRLSRTAKVALTTLRAEPHALILRTPPSDGGQDIFCGDIH